MKNTNYNKIFTHIIASLKYIVVFEKGKSFILNIRAKN